ncbi:MAG: hypothetical protein COT38_01780 [Candidatus Omnitrophica bacterium CG08_land_8_20_14_0_20_41_16]|uniref:Phosphatidylglycerol lysyltransferase C-terminal domain-containing protein n=1 Tax=Candidatus Sherwoodlollariibacterium unditelluris TaxID=1974757 RepID=A0A2G9YJ49_9BACT|nr:MAG: hypothetical protein COX41_03910 [Candidatus Omnitrophica bacterium CG23_combo_of_CG06-09_8_20_14_all_41_10]PIS34079.1 MAG: hypothetical protein COT38_01780 [Candidatus Omnitrophica bacterium CG08_land_8_20_14_0_20_41_16]
MELNKLSLQDKKIFDEYLGFDRHGLSAYSFVNIYIWKELFDISWAIIEKALCVFFQDNIGVFLYLAPLAKKNNPEVVFSVFEILGSLNRNPEFSHIENIEEKGLNFYRKLGFECSLKSHDYICGRQGLAGLKGNKFKSKRASYNYFIKHFDYQYQKLLPKDQRECLGLYSLWVKQRKSGNPERIYQGMLEDSRSSLKEALDNYSKLGFRGAKVKIGPELKAFTFGFELNKDTFCILYEITDLTIKGLAQFIFSKFAQELKNYEYINIMDDSGLDNLKRVKLSYHPNRLEPAYIVRRKHEQTYDKVKP